MIVVKDCTGTYLRLNNKDYKVCNFKTVVSFKEGEKVKASFDKIENCSEEIGLPVTCFLFHEYESQITIKKIKSF
ncbi:MAG: hypothetical protein WBP45_01070, partial [Daejeonella sp.]